jgi:hypothetical protein
MNMDATIRTAALLLDIQVRGLSSMLDTIKRAEQLANQYGEQGLARDLYAMGCELGSSRHAST